MVDRFRAAALEWVLPGACCFCGAALREGPACSACSARLPWNENACRACAIPLPAAHPGVCKDCLADSPAQDRSWTAFRYEPVISARLLSLKFHAHLAPAQVLGTLMAGRLARRAEPLPELLVPVPLHPARLAWRGYNQALELARALSRHLAIALAPRATRRLRTTGEQTRLSAAERRRNVRGAFEVGEAVRDRHIAIVDDVITTGATAGELARCARLAGARRIEVWAAARAS